ncbi:hypothetical protein HYALB_00011322 [Hymenoscyphus albidus]|uniref:Uncharacterized protein n=1 Tax=Hymenoscyphus albidus TaxID=595503 RepID=A0A9N9Q3B7_9HELO|nr:hypothetical protein HYALB_00011322 [Hymenoscyphus albidus]
MLLIMFLLLEIAFSVCFISCAVSAVSIGLSNQPKCTYCGSVWLRVEGSTQTLFEGHVSTSPNNITLPSSKGTHCDGTNNNANPYRGATATNYLLEASSQPWPSKLPKFTVDGLWYEQFDDFLITRIGTDIQTQTMSWDLLVNWKFAEVGGCQIQPNGQSQVLWAYGAYTAGRFLDIAMDVNFNHEKHKIKVAVGEPILHFVRDLKTETLVEGASLLARGFLSNAVEEVIYPVGRTTNINGTIQVHFRRPGYFYVKAEREGDLRSIGLAVLVVPM